MDDNVMGELVRDSNKVKLIRSLTWPDSLLFTWVIIGRLRITGWSRFIKLHLRKKQTNKYFKGQDKLKISR